MMHKICLPIRESSQEKILEIFQQAENHCDIFEVWLDTIKNLNISTLVSSCPKPLLCVCKATEEKGDFQGTEEERVELLIQAAHSGAGFIDIGLHTNIELIEKLKQNIGSAKLIISYHNWDNTPKLTSILTRVNQIIDLSPDYIKYVATAQKQEDNIQIYRLAENLKKKNLNFIVMCMGESGKISRVVTPLLGSAWTYAPIDTSAASAPGQIAIEDLRNIWDKLNS